ncbi:MAG: hypothetical protein PHS60_10165 [Zavarzinia sp.]|nr:hypothetical protein [Zavarzinia sp.]
MSVLNPELRRNFWLEFSATRLIVMPLVMGLLFSLGWLWDEWAGVAGVAQAAGWAVLVLWGTRLAADGIVSEVQGKTWDGQRLSGTGPGAMVVGKLFGATAYAWTGGLMCIAAVAVAGGLAGDAWAPLRLLVTGLFAQAVALWFALVQLRLQSVVRRFQVLLAQVVGIITSIQLAPAYDFVKATVSWYGIDFAAYGFAFFLTALMTLWAWVGCWRLMRADFRYRNWPLAFLAFLVFITVFTGGVASGSFPGLGWVFEGAVTYHLVVLATWVAAMLEPKSIVLLRRLIERFRRGDVAGFLADLPCAVAGLPLVVLVGIVGAVQGPPGWGVGLQFLSVFLFLLRDMALVYYVVLGANGRRGHAAALIYLLVLYGLVPAILQASGAFTLIGAFLPMGGVTPVVGVGGPLVMAVLFGVLLFTRLSSSRKG